MRKLIIIIVVSMALVIGASVTASLVIANQPENVVAAALMNLSDDILDRKELSAVYSALDGGSIEMILENGGVIPELPDNATLSGKRYFDDDAFYQTMAIQADDINFTADMYMDKDEFYVYNEDILGGAWGLERGNTQKEFENSIFYYDSGEDMALSKEACTVISELLQLYDDGADQELIDDLTDTAERYYKKAWSLICKYAEFTSENDDVRIGGERVNCRVVTVVLDDRAMEKILLGLLDYWEDDDDLLDLVKKYSRIIDDIAADLPESDYEKGELFKAYNELMDQKEATEDQIRAAFDGEIEDLKIKVYTPKMSTKLLKLKISFGKESLLEIDLGAEGISETNEVMICVANTTTYIYEISEDSEDRYTAALSVEEYGEQVTLLAVDVDLEDEQYTLSFLGDLTVKGTVVTHKKNVTVTVDHVQVGDEETGRTLETKLTLILKDKDTMPKLAKKINSIFTVNQDTFDTWKQNVETKYADVIEDLQALLTANVLEGDYYCTYNNEGIYFRSDGTFVGYTGTGSADNPEFGGTYEISGDQIIFVIDGGDTVSFDFAKEQSHLQIGGNIYNKK